MSKVDIKKWETGSIVYSPVEDQIALVVAGAELAPDEVVLIRDSNGLRTLDLYPVGTAGVVEWTHLGDVNGN